MSIENSVTGTINSLLGNNTISSFAPMIIIFVLFWFLLIRPQQKKLKLHQTMLNELKVHDKIVTTGGIFAKIAKINSDTLELELAPSIVITCERSSIAKKL
jgi:preprotein translocase subunit YajC